jgi:hypothetical protein
MGNVNPLEVGVRGTPEEVREATLDVLEKSGGEGIVLSVGGGTSPGMPRENIRRCCEPWRNSIPNAAARQPKGDPMPDYALMNQCLYEGNAKEVEQMTKDALAEGRPVQEVLNEGPDRRHERGGRGFQIQHSLRARSADRRARDEGRHGGAEAAAHGQGPPCNSRVGTLLMGTVRGDLHDIGKNLVCMMAEGAGFKVHDIGVDQSIEKFLAAPNCTSPTSSA